MATRLAINGMGRIGRCVVRAILQDRDRYGDIELVAINDPAALENTCHLLKYDSVHGNWNTDISRGDGDSTLTIGDTEVRAFSTRDVEDLDWKSVGADVVVDATGVFRDRASASRHLDQGASKVIITAPAKDPDVTICLGVNDDAYDPASHHIVSNASCTTNCLAPVAKVLHENLGIRQGFITTCHAYTSDQRLLDAAHKDPRRARAAALSVIPTSTGAAKAIALVLPDLAGKLDGLALRVPVPSGSITDIVVEVDRETTADEVNDLLRSAAESGPTSEVLEYSTAPIVSSDIVGNPASSIVDGPLTMANGRHVKVLAWYDNEWGYSARVADLVTRL